MQALTRAAVALLAALSLAGCGADLGAACSATARARTRRRRRPATRCRRTRSRASSRPTAPPRPRTSASSSTRSPAATRSRRAPRASRGRGAHPTRRQLSLQPRHAGARPGGADAHLAPARRRPGQRGPARARVHHHLHHGLCARPPAAALSLDGAPRMEESEDRFLFRLAPLPAARRTDPRATASSCPRPRAGRRCCRRRAAAREVAVSRLDCRSCPGPTGPSPAWTSPRPTARSTAPPTAAPPGRSRA